MRWRGCAFAFGVLSVVFTSAHAGGMLDCGTWRDTTLQVSGGASSDFTPYRRGVYRVDLTARDIEFQWDPLYTSMITTDVRTTLHHFHDGLAVSSALSPLATDANTLQAFYNYFRQRGSDWNTWDASDSLAFRMGKGRDDTTTWVGQYTNADRAHVDLYVLHPSQATVGGAYPSWFDGPNEDVSTGHSSGDLRHRNSIMVTGPWSSQSIDLSGTGWTSPQGYRRLNFAHETMHGLPLEGGGLGETGDGYIGHLDELWSAGAEAVVGIKDSTEVTSEVPYTWPFLSNYQQRTSFMAYVGYNFLNEDQNRTLAGIHDDLMYRWSRGDRKLTGLRDRLGDDSCFTCAGKGYFRPGGESLANGARFALLHHNWRVANFVNRPSLDEGQYGFPSWSGFSPGHLQKAWQDMDYLASDDLVAIPPIVTVGPRQALRETTFAHQRSFRGGTEPLILQPMGSNYWVIRADGALWNQNRDLVVRVSPRGRYLEYSRYSPDPRFPPEKQLRFMASIVAYNSTDPGGDESDLWKYPGNAVWSSPVVWVDTDSLTSDLEIVVPNFGLTHKCAVLVLSLGDERGDWIGSNLIPGFQAQPYRLDLSLKPSGQDGRLPVPFSTTAGYNEDYASWSPAGDELVFMAKLPQFSSATQIYRMKLDGTGLTRLAPQVNHQYAPDWSPRGNLIAFEGVTEQGDSRIWMVNLDTPWNSAYDVSNLPGVETMPSFQPNGQGLAFIHIPPYSGTWELRWASYDGTGARVVATFPAVQATPRPAWNPSGTRIYLTLNDSLYSVSVSGGSLAPDQTVRVPVRWIDFHGGRGRALVGTALPVPNQADYTSNFMAAQQYIQTANRIALLDTAAASRDTSFRYAVRQPAETLHPRYSPDGTRIAFTQTDASGRGDLYVGRITPNHAPLLYPIEDISEPACVPMLFQFTASDPDGEALTYRADYLPPGASIVNGNWFRWQSPSVGDYHVVFRALDGSAGVSSRVVRIQIFDDGQCYEALGEGGGGGAGFRGRTADANRLIPFGSGTTPIANSLLDGAHPDVWIEQIARLTAASVFEDGTVQSSLLARLAGVTTIDRAGLIAVDHPAGSEAFSTPDGIVVGYRQAVASAVDGNGTEQAPLPGDESGEPLTLAAGATLDVTLPANAREGVVLDCARGNRPPAESESGIEVAVESGGAWQPLARLHPRLKRDRLAIALSGMARVRLTALSDVQLRSVDGLASGNATRESVTLHAVAPGPIEDVDSPAALLADDDDGVALDNSQTLTLSFAPPVAPQGTTRTHFLTLRARYSLASAGTARGQQVDAELPARFAFAPGVPNPFGRSTTLRFDVPRASRVRLEAFDVLGRRVRTLVDGAFAAGSHAVNWDGSGDDGAPAHPGIYLVRMSAAGFTAHRRIVRLAN